MQASYRIRITPRALADLQHIFEWIQKDSPQNAARMIKTLIDAIDGLDILPHRYPVLLSSAGAARKTRSMPVQPYLVRYRVDDLHMAVHILHVRHGARQKTY